MIAELRLSSSPEALARAMLPFASHLEFRGAGIATHQEALASARAALRSSAMYRQVQEMVGVEQADAVTLLLFATADHLTPTQRAWLGTLNGPIADELSNLQAQLTALLGVTSRAS